ncbi:GPI inositol-deacylase-like protein [Trichodelitschia bisporula]|uniref:GPI inositol-deacylase n=1 Tax=Trichodelitschia bisporula TaxID=703511 RepID=A0A6G1I056_9PEZI|nr:GPI inositol-deacylase-like protein [Trichodelitschia bisporula]
MIELRAAVKDIARDVVVETQAPRRRARWLNPWSCSWLSVATLVTAATLMLAIMQSFTTRQRDPIGTGMSYMASGYVPFPEFDTEHTRFATKYSLHLYREMGIDEDYRVKGVPVLFIPGNAGSFKQVRSFAAEAEEYYANHIRPYGGNEAKRALDFFTVDFNEDITAFHGQTLLDQAEYLNDAIAYILSIYHDPERSKRDPSLPDPSSVILVGHSMGGVVARTMLTMPNYQANSVNTIITLAAPHARPPVSFDAQMVSTYKQVNEYWRKAHATEWGSDNPLWHVTLISIAGGGLDTMIPSEYSSVTSLVPDTHGFTVFTSSIPDVWMGMDHLAITWCDELRKAVIRALYDVMDVNRAAQTKPRGMRMRSFKKWLLTGLEDIAEKTLPFEEPKTLLTLEDDSNAIISQGERLVLRSFGQHGKKKAYLLPIPPQGSSEGRKFTLLSDQHLDAPGESGNLEVLFCSVFPLQVGNTATLLSMNMDLSGDGSGSRLACKNAASDTIRLPASTRDAKHPFEKRPPFSYLQYDLEDLVEHQFVAVVDKATSPTAGWVVAEFNAGSESVLRSTFGLRRLLSTSLRLRLPAKRPLMMDLKIPALDSSMLAYRLKISSPACGDGAALFTPLVRQYISDVYESKFFVNLHEADINLHGVAPYMPPALRGRDLRNGLALQIWTDPTCKSALDLDLRLDVVGSFGKLWMRYRTIFATFPLLAVALVLRKQFQVHEESGVFMSFSEGMNQCLRKSVPIVFTLLSGCSLYFAQDGHTEVDQSNHYFNRQPGNATESLIDYTKNDLLMGSPDPFFWFLLPIFGVISLGLCIAINYVALALTYFLTMIYSSLRSIAARSDGRTLATFTVTPIRTRFITTGLLLLLVSTVIPYQFAYIVLCLVQIATCVRALRVTWDTRSDANCNFYNYTHSILVLMLWIFPINVPTLAVWIRNLSVHWLTPFSSHHNILSIMPYILLVETLSTGRMIPRLQTRLRNVTDLLLFVLAFSAAVYGVSYAYLLHHLVNILCMWFVIIHWSTSPLSFSRLFRLLDGASEVEGHPKKRP